jgi:CHASE3 domain sensor protein
MIDQSHITGRVNREHDVITGKPIFLLFINDEFIKEYKTYPAALGQMTKRIKQLFNDELMHQHNDEIKGLWNE